MILGQNQVDAGSLEVSVEQQLRVGNDDRIRRRVRRMLRKSLKMGVPMAIMARDISRKLGVEFA
jgi:hypothetical protein